MAATSDVARIAQKMEEMLDNAIPVLTSIHEIVEGNLTHQCMTHVYSSPNVTISVSIGAGSRTADANYYKHSATTEASRYNPLQPVRTHMNGSDQLNSS
jgi:hypothetical protein